MLNAHALQRPGSATMLQGVFPFAAMTNHSCRPNSTHMACAAAPEGAPSESTHSDLGDDPHPLWMRLRAVRDIPEGEEITISYLNELMLPLEERVRFLNGGPDAMYAVTFFFLCGRDDATYLRVCRP